MSGSSFLKNHFKPQNVATQYLPSPSSDSTGSADEAIASMTAGECMTEYYKLQLVMVAR